MDIFTLNFGNMYHNFYTSLTTSSDVPENRKPNHTHTLIQQHITSNLEIFGSYKQGHGPEKAEKQPALCSVTTGNQN